MMRNNYILFLIALLISGCSSCESCNKDKKNNVEVNINHYNITIASDLSNRLNTKFYPKAVSDTSILNLVIDNIYPRILTHRRKMNQNDQFRIDFINKKQINAYQIQTKNLEIDFKKFDKQIERIAYLRGNFNVDANLFKNEFRRINEKAIIEPYGSDIWTYFNEGVNKNIVDNSKSISRFGDNQFLNQQKNTLILLTDGYIESGIYAQGYDLSGSKIADFRNMFNKSGEKDLNFFYKKHPEFAIRAVNNPLLKNLHVLVLEIYDRTESNQGATVHPTDTEIIKLFWKDWLSRSGVKEVEIHPKFSNKAEAEKVIFDFIGV